MNFTPLEVGRKFNFSDVVEKICSDIKGNKESLPPKDNGAQEKNGQRSPNRIYKTRDKWIKLTTQLPQAVFHCMQGNLKRCLCCMCTESI